MVMVVMVLVLVVTLLMMMVLAMKESVVAHNDLQRVIVSDLLKAPWGCSPVAKSTKPNVQEWVGEVNRLLPEYFTNVTRPQKATHSKCDQFKIQPR